MDWRNQLTKTPYLILFMVLISIGVGTASALITITLAGNVIVTGDLDVNGNITGSTIEQIITRVTNLENETITITKLARGSDYVDQNFERGIKFIDLHSPNQGASTVLDVNGTQTSGFDLTFRDVGQAQTMTSYKIEIFDGDSNFQKFLEPHDIQTILYIDGNSTAMQCLIPFGQNNCTSSGNISILSDQGWAIGYFVTDDLSLDPIGPTLEGPIILASYTVEIPQ